MREDEPNDFNEHTVTYAMLAFLIVILALVVLGG